MKNISILGATGSIGTQTLDVIRNSNNEIKLIGVSANSSVEKIKEIINEFNPKYVAMMDEKSSKAIKDYCLDKNLNIEVYSGIEGLEKIATLEEIDMVLTSVVGMIGLRPTIKAIEAKKDIALANKETLVVAGELVMKKAKEMGVDILPVDSEHSAIFQALNGYTEKDVNKIILTASGGPFRGKDNEYLKNVTVKDALKHPKWNMGQKISIDSATLMNKGLEVIEAHFLFNCSYENIEVVVHPQSIIHSMVEYNDASVIAQLGSTDMKLPIQYAINKKERKHAIAERLNFYEIGALTFEKPDLETFKCLKLAYKVGREGGLAPCILNGANEEAVALLLEEKIKFLQVAEIIEEALEYFKEEKSKEVTLENVIELDKKVREYIRARWN
ncbi:1-deoxy-D-xylulose-5-phosphate reductoisomerase [Clostridium tertium]|jgi:1-deoxy-D-xylulose-5-phosphate reductoisomerase|uniref:1-deoxy-D-xylulose 5-phosphate reductoisomerase n=2 Tax=Clostridium tertium TaxID=1559 RepID=A0A9X4AZS0_9CLOT|nr:MULTISPECIES: 1-deoxy-D-xylulose-5-phosphate reductoisomerase [Clostridium]EEH98142.1 1-deoxy-D-xylulose 5-phosphate reductoisomerase [Clostridium sp. 7_2_43FAA]MBP1867008.1 1-deoxy-D-xylulose-5-phosphate reductoisomerase [Clostridium tertium]MBS5305222.1 1-deoxy-D-xylulose-5-phosphate reductoisomerase [Clostridium sp.]MBU6135686.1 1-deoxy-D-xylulose-5-phosphate reductoisomerase [Clostridium tertium]MDB1921887.1 1-deoxy-D-xylulose-5-phosphate reductoisomerase [Clostridium tertium]